MSYDNFRQRRRFRPDFDIRPQRRNRNRNRDRNQINRFPLYNYNSYNDNRRMGPRDRFRRNNSIAIALKSTRRNNPWSSITRSRGGSRRPAPISSNRPRNRNMSSSRARGRPRDRNMPSNSRRYNQRDTRRWSSNYKVQQRANAVYRSNNSYSYEYRNNAPQYNQRQQSRGRDHDIRHEPIYKDVWSWDKVDDYRPVSPRATSWKRKKREIQTMSRTSSHDRGGARERNRNRNRNRNRSQNTNTNANTNIQQPKLPNGYDHDNENKKKVYKPPRVAIVPVLKTVVASRSNTSRNASSYTNQESKATQSKMRNNKLTNVPSSKLHQNVKMQLAAAPQVVPQMVPPSLITKSNPQAVSRQAPHDPHVPAMPSMPPPTKAPILPRKSPPKLLRKKVKRRVMRNTQRRLPLIQTQITSTGTKVVIGAPRGPPYAPAMPRTLTPALGRSSLPRTIAAAAAATARPITQMPSLRHTYITSMQPQTSAPAMRSPPTSRYRALARAPSRSIPSQIYTQQITRNIVRMPMNASAYAPATITIATSQPNISQPNLQVSQPNILPTNNGTGRYMAAPTYNPSIAKMMHTPQVYLSRPATPKRNGTPTPQRTPPIRTPQRTPPKYAPSSTPTLKPRNAQHQQHHRRIIAVTPPIYAPSSSTPTSTSATCTPTPPVPKQVKLANKAVAAATVNAVNAVIRALPPRGAKAARRSAMKRKRGDEQMYVVGINDCGQFGMNHTGKVNTLTRWQPPAAVKKEIVVDEINVSFAGLIITDSKENKFWAMGTNKCGSCAIPHLKGSGYITRPTEIQFFKQNNIGIHTIFSNICGGSVFWMTNCNEIYGNGCNEHHQLGVGDTEHKFVPTRILSLCNIVKMTSAHQYSLALDSDGAVFSTTQSHYGGNGHGPYKNDGNYGWKRISALRGIKIIEIDNGDEHSLFLSADGTVYSVGCGNFDQLGNGLRGANQAIFPVHYFKNEHKRIVAIACGREHNLCIDHCGVVYAWGSNLVGQCGDHPLGTYTGKKLNSYGKKIACGGRSPGAIPYLRGKTIVDIKCGTQHSYVRTNQNQHYLFGSNRYNESSLYDVGSPYISTPNSINHVLKEQYKEKATWGIKEVYLGANTSIIIVGDLGYVPIKNRFADDHKESIKIHNSYNKNTQAIPRKTSVKSTKKKSIKQVQKIARKTKEIKKKKNDKILNSKLQPHSEYVNWDQVMKEQRRKKKEKEQEERKEREEMLRKEKEKEKEDFKKLFALENELQKMRKLRLKMEKKIEEKQKEKSRKEEQNKMQSQSQSTQGDKSKNDDKIRVKDDDDEKGDDAFLQKAKDLLNAWFLGQYIPQLIDENGYEDVEDWKGITEDELIQMGFKKGHRERFARLKKEIFVNPDDDSADSDSDSDDDEDDTLDLD